MGRLTALIMIRSAKQKKGLYTVTNLQPGRRAASFWVVRFIFSLVVDNCMLWYLFQGRITLPMILTTALSSPTQDVCNSTDIIRPSDSLTCSLCRLWFRSLSVCLFFCLAANCKSPAWLFAVLKKQWEDILKWRVCTVVSLFCAQDLLQEVKQLKKKVEELEGEKGQYERKLRGTKVFDETARSTRHPTTVCIR